MHAVAPNDFEAYFFAFVEGSEPAALDGCEVYEYVFAVFTFDETIALFRAKPFYSTSHAEAS
jgi:hypothetical protein